MSFTNFERICRERNLKPGTVARKSGVASSTLAAWKQGKYTPKLEKIKRLADQLDVPVNYIIGDADIPDQQEHYLDAETIQIAQALFENKDLRRCLRIILS